jgi:hypothetical protein
MYGMIYGTMGRMTKTTLYLPLALKARLERVAAERGESEAEIVRSALDAYTTERRPRPRLPLATGPSAPTDVAERVDDVLAEGFGRS